MGVALPSIASPKPKRRKPLLDGRHHGDKMPGIFVGGVERDGEVLRAFHVFMNQLIPQISPFQSGLSVVQQTDALHLIEDVEQRLSPLPDQFQQARE